MEDIQAQNLFAECPDTVIKKSLIAVEQKRPKVHLQRVNSQPLRRLVDTTKFVFLDETEVKTNITRLYDRSRYVDHQPGGCWSITTILGAIHPSGVIPEATICLDQTVDGHLFLFYTNHFRIPSLEKGDVVMMDNLSAHKIVGIREAIESVGANLGYIPPYSPDLNPIEKLWSKAKPHLRSLATRSIESLRQSQNRRICKLL